MHTAAVTAVFAAVSADSSQTGPNFIGGIKMKCDFLKKFEKTKWGQKFCQVHTGAGTAVSPT